MNRSAMTKSMRTLQCVYHSIKTGQRSTSSVSIPIHTQNKSNTLTTFSQIYPTESRTNSRSFRSLSTAASVSEPESEPRKRPLKKKNPIIVTEQAAERIKELLSSPNGAGALGIRLGVKRRGCNGLSYTLNYAMERQKNEEELTVHGVTVFIEPMALFNVVGTVMDFEVTDMSSEFTFQNPNSKGECGCGESFNI